MEKIIAETDKFKLVRPYHSWDMNYHLFNKEIGIEMLIDIHDVFDDEDITLWGLEEVEGIHWDELKELDTLGDLPYVIWRVLDKDGEVIQVVDIDDMCKFFE